MKYRLVTLCILSVGIVMVLAFLAASNSSATGSLTEETIICLDPGHGGFDPGAVNSDYNLRESDINLDVSYGLKALLEGDGALVVIARTDDSYKENSDRYDFCNAEKATILVSVHTNSVEDETWDGSMALYFRPHGDDKILAQAIHDVMYPYLKGTAPDPDNFRDFGLDWFASGVLLRSDMPAAMMEPLFMSNPAEAAMLVQTIYNDPENSDFSTGCDNYACRRGQIAQSIHQGILHYFDIIGPSPEPDGEMHVSDITMWYEQKRSHAFIYTHVLIHDSDGVPVPAVAVSVDISDPNGSLLSYSGNTDENGTVTFKVRTNLSGTFQSTVTDVNKDGWVYDEANNSETSESLVAP